MKGNNDVSDRDYSPFSPSSGATAKGLLFTLLAALSIFVLTLGVSRVHSSQSVEIENQFQHWEALYEEVHSIELCVAIDLGPVLNGTDVVAYFGLNPKEKAIQGNPAYVSNFSGYTFWFSTEANKKKFEGDPLRYVPQWGGFCAWGIAEESIWNPSNLGPPADPDFWMISEEGKLYIFRCNTAITKFMRGVHTAVEDGNNVWKQWWGDVLDSSGQPFNTGCFCNVDICADGW